MVDGPKILYFEKSGMTNVAATAAPLRQITTRIGSIPGFCKYVRTSEKAYPA